MASAPVVEAVSCDVLVIGGGVAALRAAVAACEVGADVVVCCKGIAGRSGNTVVSTADISAFVPELGLDDSPEIYLQDTLSTGGDIADEQLIAILAERSGPALLDLERLGIPLLRDGDAIDRTRGAGHSRARTYRADAKGIGANKGLALSIPLTERVRALGGRILDRTPIVHLVVQNGTVVGAIGIDIGHHRLVSLSARAVIVASGGASHLFARTNGTADATGDVIALALRAGAEARDLEFVQWHPTRMDQPVPLFLTNGLLADGAVFRNRDGREFMFDYDQRGSLAPRDVLAKSTYLEAQSGRGVDGGVYLDCSPIPDERISLRHAYLAQTLQKHQVNFPTEWLVVSPSTHFLMGGLRIDTNAASTLPGLYVAGEAAGGIHGANRLGGNAFCEGLVFGTIAGQRAALHAVGAETPRITAADYRPILSLVDAAAPDPRPQLGAGWQRLREAMWADASLVRDAVGLARVADVIANLGTEVSQLRAPTLGDSARILDLWHALDCAGTMVAAATLREESRGAHWRTDFPAADPHWFGSIHVAFAPDSADPKLTFVPKTNRRVS